MAAPLQGGAGGFTATVSASDVRSKIHSLRLSELQQVVTRLGLKKSGRKGELQDRILSYFGELDPNRSATLGRQPVRGPQQQWKIEQAAKVVNEAYSRMMGLPTSQPGSDQSAHSNLLLPIIGSNATHHHPGSPKAATAAASDPRYREQQAAAAAVGVATAGAATAYQQQNAQPPALNHQLQSQLAAGSMAGPGGSSRPVRVRCICQLHVERGRMVRCQGQGCGVWQHAECLGMDQQQQQRHLCELCRARLADPFWEATEQVLPASRLKPQPGRPAVQTSAGTQEVQCADRVFYLNSQQLEAVQRDPEHHRLQLGCLLLGDEVAQRYHWPKHVDLKVNSLPHRPYSRALNAKMGINQRDDVASIGMMLLRGRNSLSISAADGGIWVLTLQLARKRTLEQVKQLMAAPEPLDEAAARVRRQVGGGGDDGDSDEELLVSHQVVSLKDPLSGQLMKVPARFRGASGLQAFELDSFLGLAARNRKWQDPTTLSNSSIEQLQVDAYMQQVLRCLRPFPAVTDVEISADGTWRPEGSSCDWLDITADPASVAAALRASLVGAAGAEAEAAAAAANGTANGTTAAANGAAGLEELVVPDSEEESEEEDEMEELRKAAAAVRQAAASAVAARQAGQKRKQPDEVEVIDLLSDSDEELAPSTQHAQQAAQPPLQLPPASQYPPPNGQRPLSQQPHAAASASQQLRASSQPAGPPQPIRIRLPVRPRPVGAGPGAGAPPAAGAGPRSPTLQQEALGPVAASGAAAATRAVGSSNPSIGGLPSALPDWLPSVEEMREMNRQGLELYKQSQELQKGAAGASWSYPPGAPATGLPWAMAPGLIRGPLPTPYQQPPTLGSAAAGATGAAGGGPKLGIASMYLPGFGMPGLDQFPPGFLSAGQLLGGQQEGHVLPIVGVPASSMAAATGMPQQPPTQPAMQQRAPPNFQAQSRQPPSLQQPQAAAPPQPQPLSHQSSAEGQRQGQGQRQGEQQGQGAASQVEQWMMEDPDFLHDFFGDDADMDMLR